MNKVVHQLKSEVGHLNKIIASLEAEAVLAQRSDLNIDSVEKMVTGALKSAINAHGPITKELVGSATKRIMGDVKAYLRSLDNEQRND